jgi:hypothetical protein
MADKTVIVEIQYDTNTAINSLNNLTDSIVANKEQQAAMNKAYKDGTITAEQYSQGIAELKEEEKKTNAERGNTIKLLGSEKGSINELSAEVKRLTSERNKLDRTTSDGKKGIQDYNTKINDLKSALKGAQSETGKTGGAFASLKDSLSDLPGPAGGVVSSIGAMTKAGLAFIATPVGAVIAAIVAALMLLKKAFMGTEENQNKVSKGLAVLSGIFNTLMNVLRPVAEFIFDKIGAAFKFLGEQADMAVKLVSKGLNLLGFDKAAKALDNFNSKVKENIQLAKELADAEAKLRNEQRVGEKTMLDYQKQAEKLRQIRDDESKSIEERIQANAKLGTVLKEQMAVELGVAKTALDVAEKRIKLEGASSENLDKRAEALNKISDIQERITGQESEQLANLNSLRREQEALIQNEIKLRDEIFKQTIEQDKVSQKADEDRMKADLEMIQQESEASLKASQDELARRGEAIMKLAEEKQKELEINASSIEELRNIKAEAATQEYEMALLNKQLTDEELELLDYEHKQRLAEIDATYQEQLYQQAFDSMQNIIAATQDMGDRRVTILNDAFSKISTINFKEVKSAADGFVQIGQAASGLTNLIVANHDKELSDLEQQKAYELSLVGDNKEEQDKINKKYAQKTAELKTKQAEDERNKTALDVFFATAIAVTKSIAESPLTLGLPWSAVIAGMGLIQEAAILSKPIPNFNTYAKGGIIGGKSHSQGGTKFYGEDGSMFEAERGEAMFVLKKDATAEIAALSQLNESKGGRSFTSGSSHLAEGGEVSGVNIEQAIKNGMKGVNIVVGVESIETGLTNYNKVKEAAVI